MAVSVTAQALSFLGALGLGGALGLLYDLFRLLRTRLGLRWLGGGLDLLYWLAVVVSLFVYCVAAGNGDVRIYLMLGTALGGGVYFLTLSAPVLFLGNKMWDLFFFLGTLCLRPFRYLKNLSKKNWRNGKKDFHYRRKWYKINANIGEMDRKRRSEDFADQKGGGPHKDSGAGAAHLSLGDAAA